MRIAYINKEDVLNGPGIRVSLWTQGCPFRCPECHNPALQDFDGGSSLSAKHIYEILDALGDTHVDKNLSILGGEPLADSNWEEVKYICAIVKNRYPDKTIWIWTGYTLEQLEQTNKKSILEYIDVLVDGPFLKALYDPTLEWRGSSNQRIIEVNKRQS